MQRYANNSKLITKHHVKTWGDIAFDFLAFSVFTGMGIFLTMTTANAADTALVNATVTVQNVSVTVADGTIAYGTIVLAGNKDTTTSGVNDSQTATNNGNVPEDINIRGQNSAPWTLGATAGSDQYAHKFCTTNCDASPTWTALTTNYQQLANAIAASGTSTFDLQVLVPTTSTSYVSQDVSVTVQAVAD